MDSRNQELIADAGGLELIAAALRSHTSSRVQRAGIGALWNLAADENNVQSILSSSLVELVLKAMKAHVRTADVQRNACGFLWNLGRSTAAQAKVVSLGGLEALQDAIHTYREAKELRWYCCGSLSTFARHASEVG